MVWSLSRTPDTNPGSARVIWTSTQLIQGREKSSDRRPGYGRPVLGWLGETARPHQPLHAQPQMLHLGDGEVLLQRLAQRPVQVRAQRGERRQRLRRDGLAGPAPQHRAQLVLDVEGDAVVDAVD